MKRLLIKVIALLALPNALNSSHLYNQKEIVVTSESNRESIELAKYLNKNGVIKYELFGKQAYKELNVVECAKDGKNSQTQLCIDKNIQGFPTWEIDGNLILGVLTLNELSEITGYKNK